MPSDVNIPAHSSHSPVPAQVQQLGLAGVPNRLIPQSPSLLLGSSLSRGGGGRVSMVTLIVLDLVWFGVRSSDGS